VDDAGLAVDVAPLEREELFRAKPRSCRDDRDRAPGTEFGGDGLDFLPGLEGANLGSLRLRVGNGLRDVLGDDQRSRAMREAYGQFYEAVGARLVAHNGDPVLASNVTAAAAKLDEYGSWKVRKARQSRKIDGLVASVIAFSRAARTRAEPEEPLMSWA
jgi:hypothetical protein